MTCIVGLTSKGKVYIGADSAGVAGLNLQVRADCKVFTTKEFAFGFCGSFRMGQLLRYSFKPPRRHPETDLYKYMVTDFINEVRKTLKDGGYAAKKDDIEKGGFFLVGHAGRLFYIESDYQVGEAATPYNATGCGAPFAIGSLFSSKGEAEKRIREALDAAEANSAGVRGPFHVVNV